MASSQDLVEGVTGWRAWWSTLQVHVSQSESQASHLLALDLGLVTYHIIDQRCNYPSVIDQRHFSIHLQNKSQATDLAKSLQSCPTLCNSIDGSPPGSRIPGILQARTLEWVAISFSNAWKWKVKVKLLSRGTLSDPMDCSLPGSSIHGIFQARVLEWGAIAFSVFFPRCHHKLLACFLPSFLQGLAQILPITDVIFIHLFSFTGGHSLFFYFTVL